MKAVINRRTSIIKDSPVSYLDYKLQQRDVRRKKLLRLEAKGVEFNVMPGNNPQTDQEGVEKITPMHSHAAQIENTLHESRSSGRFIVTEAANEPVASTDLKPFYTRLKNAITVNPVIDTNIFEYGRIMEDPRAFDSITIQSTQRSSIAYSCIEDLDSPYDKETAKPNCDESYEVVTSDSFQINELQFSPWRTTLIKERYKSKQTNETINPSQSNLSKTYHASSMKQHLNHEIQKLIDDFESDENDEVQPSHCSPMVLSFTKRKSDKSYSNVQPFKRKLVYDSDDDAMSLDSEPFEDGSFFCESSHIAMLDCDVNVDLNKNSHIFNNLTQLDKILSQSSGEPLPQTICTSTPEKNVLSVSMTFATDWPSPPRSDKENEELDNKDLPQTTMKNQLNFKESNTECEEANKENDSQSMEENIPERNIVVETKRQVSDGWMDGLEDLFDEDIGPAEMADAQPIPEVPVPSFLDKVMNGTLMFELEKDVETSDTNAPLPFDNSQGGGTGFQFANGKKVTTTMMPMKYGLNFFGDILNE